MQDVTNSVSLLRFYSMYDIPLLLDSVILLHFSHDRYNWSPSFSSTTFQNLKSISDLLLKVSKFHHPRKLCSRCMLVRALFLLNAAFAMAKRWLNVVSSYCILYEKLLKKLTHTYSYMFLLRTSHLQGANDHTERKMHKLYATVDDKT
jgi:hypothetical protein